jgi:hypothetical protein
VPLRVAASERRQDACQAGRILAVELLPAGWHQGSRVLCFNVDFKINACFAGFCRKVCCARSLFRSSCSGCSRIGFFFLLVVFVTQAALREDDEQQRQRSKADHKG